LKLARPVLCLALVASVTAAGAAGAATKPKPKPVKPVCNLVTDDKGDGAGLVNNQDGLDVLSGDLASNAKSVTAVIRLAAAPVAAGNPDAPEGAAYYFVFSVPGATNPLYLTASSDVTGKYSFAMGDVQPSPTGGQLYQNATGTVTGHINGSVITMTVDRGVLGALGDVKPGQKVTGLGVEVFYPVEVPMVGGLLEEADSASGKSYVAGALSCVKPGS